MYPLDAEAGGMPSISNKKQHKSNRGKIIQKEKQDISYDTYHVPNYLSIGFAARCMKHFSYLLCFWSFLCALPIFIEDYIVKFRIG
jgi:hypothetical protein